MRTGAQYSVPYNNVISFEGLKFSEEVLGKYIGRY